MAAVIEVVMKTDGKLKVVIHQEVLGPKVVGLGVTQ